MQNASFQMSFNIGVGVGGFGRAVSEWVNKNYNSRTQSDLIIPVPSRFLFSWELRCDLGPRATSSDNWDNWLICKMGRGLSHTNILGIILDCVFSMDCFIQRSSCLLDNFFVFRNDTMSYFCVNIKWVKSLNFIVEICFKWWHLEHLWWLNWPP